MRQACKRAKVAAAECLQSSDIQHLETDRVRRHTSPHVNERIDRLTHASVQASVAAGSDAIRGRLAELDHESDVDRALMVNFALAGGIFFTAGMLRYSNPPLFGPRPKGLFVRGRASAAPDIARLMSL